MVCGPQPFGVSKTHWLMGLLLQDIKLSSAAEKALLDCQRALIMLVQTVTVKAVLLE